MYGHMILLLPNQLKINLQFILPNSSRPAKYNVPYTSEYTCISTQLIFTQLHCTFDQRINSTLYVEVVR